MTTAAAPTALDRLADAYWEAFLRRHPTFATALGDRRFDDRLEDNSSEANQAWRALLDGFELELADIGDDGDSTTRAALADALRVDRAVLDADVAAFNVDPMNGPQVELLNIPSYQPIRSPAEADALLERWRAMPAYLDQAVADLRRGTAEGRTAVAMLCTKVIQQLDELLDKPDAEWPLAEPAREAPEIRDRLLEVIGQEIRPAFERYRAVIVDEIAPNARPDDRPGLEPHPGWRRGVSAPDPGAHVARHRPGGRPRHRPRGDPADRRRVRRARCPPARAPTAWPRPSARLREDPALHFTSREEIEASARASLERANAAIGDWFGRLPKAPCEVVVMQAHEEKHSTIAYYRDPAADGSRPGQYYINTYAPETRPRYEAETLAFHESVPGHHLQLAIMQEVTELPAFRRFNGSTAYIEGWGLYTERLSEEMGLLSSEIDRFGVLSFDAWRASRLVVDTGMHALGWTRQQAIDFMVEHTALGENNIANEVDRYISYAGQALAYKLGQLEILRLRSEARERQGDRFDIRRFHDAVLEQGALPLPVLRAVVERTLT